MVGYRDFEPVIGLGNLDLTWIMLSAHHFSKREKWSPDPLLGILWQRRILEEEMEKMRRQGGGGGENEIEREER